eukprot:CAMPEP_0185770506 /NCGR_PEP_ID=MMETSP1174-20130828/59510_1 /TAXON_ID=35687 /ORGANISM="Dictyocha speculum, Strain CCMP1381" /LENGTH=199 /DNA_ID=CAMNT_0028455967 /DNA_START=53 /DNA_END=652 /DNA_ORIENTATION=+
MAPALGWLAPTRTLLRPIVSFRLRAEPEGVAVTCNIADVDIRRLEALPDKDTIQLEDGQTAHKYFLKMTIPGETTKEYMKEIEKDSKKNADFPGFRKGQIPPWAKPKLKTFCVETALNDGIMDAMESAKLTALDGEDKNAEVLEDVAELIRGYKIGTPLSFTASFSAKEYVVVETPEEPEVIDAEVVDAEVVDAEVESV